MKRSVQKISRLAFVAAFALVAAGVTSCVTDTGTVQTPPEGVPAIISFSPVASAIPAGATRQGYHDPDELVPDGPQAEGVAADIAISELRMLLYHSSSGILADDVFMVLGDERPVTVTVLTGEYDVVFITNEQSDETDTDDGFLTQFLSDENNYNLIGKLRDALISAVAFDAGRNIPMLSIVPGVTILGDHLLSAGGNTYDSAADPGDVWTPVLERVGVRLSLEITLAKNQFEAWDNGAATRTVSIAGLPVGSYLRGGMNGDGDRQSIPATYSAAQADPGPVEGYDGYWWGVDEDDDQEPDSYIVRFDRIILPELLFDARNDSGGALSLAIEIGGESKTGFISAANPDSSAGMGYTLPRNTWLHLDVTVRSDKLLVNPEVIPWNTLPRDGGQMDNRYKLEYESHPVYISGTGWGDHFTATTDHPSHQIEVVADNHSEWITGVQPVLGSTVTAGGITTTKLQITAEQYVENVQANYREGFFYISTGQGDDRIIKRVTVIQFRPLVYAPPGVPGIKKSDFLQLLWERQSRDDQAWLHPDIELTLRGSATYSAEYQNGETAIENVAASEFGGLENEPVYMVYFKWGSMVAMIGGVGDRWGADDVVWANHDFEGPVTSSATQSLYGGFGPAPDNGGDTGPGQRDFDEQNWSRAGGHGDICIEITDGRWITPTGKPWTSLLPYSGTTTPFGTLTSASGGTWQSIREFNGAKTSWNDAIKTGVWGMGGAISDNNDIYLPASGARQNSNGSMSSVGGDVEGRYWTSSVENGVGASFLSISSYGATTVSDNPANGRPVRCVAQMAE